MLVLETEPAVFDELSRVTDGAPIDGWARKWQLGDAWCLEFAKAYVRQFERDSRGSVDARLRIAPTLEKLLNEDLTNCFERDPVAREKLVLLGRLREDLYRVMAGSPFLQRHCNDRHISRTVEDFIERLVNETESFLERLLPRVQIQTYRALERNLYWLALFRVKDGGMSYREIAELENADLKAVTEGIKSATKLLGFTQRRPKPAGRRKGSRTRNATKLIVR